jgi:hypothetical protein
MTSDQSNNITLIEEHAAPSQEGRRSIQQIVTDLSRPVAPRHIRTRKQGGATLSYISWDTAANYLDYFAPGWCWQIVSIREHGGLTVVHGALSIPATDGSVTRHATGIEDTDHNAYGDAVSNASAMAFKRAAAMFGLGRHLYSKTNE